MKKKETVEDDPLDREVDFSKAIPNPFFLGAVGPEKVRVLEPDLINAFPDSKSVNDALRTLAKPRKVRS